MVLCIKVQNRTIYCLLTLLLSITLYLVLVLPDIVIADESNSLYINSNDIYSEDRIKNKYAIGSDLKATKPIKTYEINLIPSSLVKSPRESSSAILVEKDSQTLWVYTSKNGEFIKALEIPCSTGEVDGPKMVEGDKKTPEGIYFLKEVYEDRFLTPIYGSRAFTTDYPNFLDKILGKTGSAIWIHGTNKRLKPMDSNGCVAMNSDDVVKLDPYVVLDETPVIIMDRLDYASVETTMAQRDDLLDFLSKWIESLNKGSYLEYLFHYESNYLPEVQWWAEWVDIRSRTAVSANPIKAKFDRVGIYKHKDYFVVLLNFQVSSGYRTISVGNRKLFIKSRNNVSSFYAYNLYKIIGDVFQSIENKKAEDKNNNYNDFIAAAAQLDRQYR
ncbi:MAG: L,D-transpeptidase family protein [Desulfamplus sp.]|nr:L,D-transpeptidase family protein [Desulfamplus sp.]